MSEELEKWLNDMKSNSFEMGIKYSNVMPYYIGIQDTINKIKEIANEKDKKVEKLNNIINEVREYIKNNTWEDEYGGDIIEDYNHKLLDILKENK